MIKIKNDVYKINIESPYYSYYEIKKGDTLLKISKDFNVNTKLLAELNGLKLDDYIYSGDILLIPREGVSYYITKDNDTLREVSNIFGISEENLINQNKNLYLMPGQMIFYKKG